MNLRRHRNKLGTSQSRLARVSLVSRSKICLLEVGDGLLTDDELSRVCEALQAEAGCLREASSDFDLGWTGRTK